MSTRWYAADWLLFEGKLREGWGLEVRDDGRVSSAGPEPPASATYFRNCVLLPGLVNAHSHAFQRLLRGRAEFRQPNHGSDDFWSWRELMYQAASTLDPEQLYVASRQAFVEMALAGITSVGEFHYLHRDPSGVAYADPNELAKQVIRAGRDAGLRIVLLRVAYERGGYRVPPNAVQRRFADLSPGDFLTAVDALREDLRGESAVSVGVAPHSVRAVSRGWLEEIRRQWKGVVHMHVAEQLQEVKACLEEHRKRPVELLDDIGLLGPEFTAVHALHLSRDEISELGLSGASVCVCPTTERNLGDGVVQADVLAEAKVPLCLGSDSQAQVDLLAEARDLEGHLRLLRGRRAVLDPGGGRPDGLAQQLFTAASLQGAHALGLPTGNLRLDAPADFFTVDLSHPSMSGAVRSNLLSFVIFAAEKGAIRDVAVNGELIVREGKHPLAERSSVEFANLSRQLSAQMP
jgi:formimidoylglutamate deiminase